MTIIKKILLISFLIGLGFIASGCMNPYVKKLKEYEMQLAEGRDKAFYAAMEMTQVERLGVEDQFSRQSLENTLLISAFVRATGKTPEEIGQMKSFSYDEVLKVMDANESANEKRKSEILAAYRAFFDKIDEEDAKIRAIQEGVKKAEEVRQETYQKVGETLGTTLATAGVVAAIQ